MRTVLSILIILFLIISCKKDDLSSEFNCNVTTNQYELKEYRDVLKKFRIDLPKSWKTQLYYDEFQSQLYSADTTKSLTDTYILDISWHQGELNLDANFAARVKDTLAIVEQLNVEKSDFGMFKEKPYYWTLSKGKKGKYDQNNLQLYIKTAPDEYYTITTKAYGDKNLDQRFCEAIAFTSAINFIE